MKTISILGSGWLGLPLAEALVEQGYCVNASSRSEARLDAIKACQARPFIVDINRINDTIEDFLQADMLIVNITSKDISAFKNLINKIEDSSIEKVIFVSSTSVYQNINGIVTESEGAENAESPLFRIENLFRSNTKFETTVIRFAGLIGYSRHPGRFFMNKKIPQADSPVNLIHRDDCIAIVVEIIRQQTWGEVFNACSDTHPSKRAFYSHAASLLDLPPPEMAESTDNQFKIVSNEKLKQRLGYRFKHPDLLLSGL